MILHCPYHIRLIDKDAIGGGKPAAPQCGTGKHGLSAEQPCNPRKQDVIQDLYLHRPQCAAEIRPQAGIRKKGGNTENMGKQILPEKAVGRHSLRKQNRCHHPQAQVIRGQYPGRPLQIECPGVRPGFLQQDGSCIGVEITEGAQQNQHIHKLIPVPHKPFQPEAFQTEPGT